MSRVAERALIPFVAAATYTLLLRKVYLNSLAVREVGREFGSVGDCVQARLRIGTTVWSVKERVHRAR